MKRHKPIELEGGAVIAPCRVYRLRGGYRLLVTKQLSVWQEFRGRYLCLATEREWMERNHEAGISRENTCRAANFWGCDDE